MHYKWQACSTPGSTNTLADCCSSLFHLNDNVFLNYIKNVYPAQPSWKLVIPMPVILYDMNSALSRVIQPRASIAPAQMQTTQPGGDKVCSPTVEAAFVDLCL